MRKELNDDIWESYLKTAVIQNSLKEIENYPPREEINDIELPGRFEDSMLKCAKHQSYKSTAKTVLLYMRKIASIVILILGIGFALLLQNEEVRAACQKVIISIYEQYILISYTTITPSEKLSIKIGYIPDGFTLIKSSESQIENYYIYEDSQGGILEIYYFDHERATRIDNEHYIVHKVDINDFEGIYFESQDIYFMNMLHWHTENEYFELSSTLEKEEIIKIAQNIK